MAMLGEVVKEEEAKLQGQADILQYAYSFVDSMALKCAVELGIADIINSHGKPITLTQIAAQFASPSTDIDHLSRLMRFLVHRKLFKTSTDAKTGDTLYGLTYSSMWLLSNEEKSLAPMVLFANQPNYLASWHWLSQSVKAGGSIFKKAHGSEMWDFASTNPQFNDSFNDGMERTAKIMMGPVYSEYKDGFGCIGSLVDVGGGTGGIIAEIVKSHPHIRGINFDLPHVIATAPVHEGVTHIGGDMFEAIPSAEAIFMKWILHCWGDEDCVKILKNCRKAIPEKNGKVIIVDIVLGIEDKGPFDKRRSVCDVLMMAYTKGGKERTETEWKKLLEEGGFPRYKITKVPTIPSIIEAFPM